MVSHGAEQGDAVAQIKLGSSYYLGKGVPGDYVQSYAWLSIAVKQGNISAKEIMDIVAEHMSRSQIAEAQKLSREYWDTYGPGRESK